MLILKIQIISQDMAQVHKVGVNLMEDILILIIILMVDFQDMDKDIIKAAGVKASKITLGMPGRAEAKKIIREYYLGAAK